MSLRGFGDAPAVLPASAWQDLISYVPPIAIQQQVLRRGIPAWSFHRIQDAVGPVNLDYYPVRIIRFPRKRGVELTAAQFLTHLRLNLNSFVDTRLTRFTPLAATDKVTWESANPVGAALHLDFYRLVGQALPPVNIDDGSVVVCEAPPNFWRVYTVWNPADQGHPVSGSREWGFTADGNGYVFYTRAADRLTKSMLLPFKDQVYAAQHALWISFQTAIQNFVGRNGGEATVLPPTATRYDWTVLSSQYYRPTVPWV